MQQWDSTWAKGPGFPKDMPHQSKAVCTQRRFTVTARFLFSRDSHKRQMSVCLWDVAVRHDQLCYVIMHPGVLWVRLHPRLITDSRCRWLKAGAVKKKKEKKRTSTWSLCCSSLGLLSVWLALFLQQSAARNKTYNFIRADQAFVLHLTALS